MTETNILVKFSGWDGYVSSRSLYEAVDFKQVFETASAYRPSILLGIIQHALERHHTAIYSDENTSTLSSCAIIWAGDRLGRDLLTMHGDEIYSQLALVRTRGSVDHMDIEFDIRGN